MRCLVTGGAGFIGSHLVDCLLSDGHEVTVLDNFCTGRIQNLIQHKGDPKLTILEKDISDFLSIKDYFVGVEWVFHLAARADIVPSIVSPIDYHSSNVDGTVAVLEASRRAGVKRFLYTASSSCYGIPDTYPTPETAPIRPQYPYALTKYLGEECALHWAQVYKLPAVSLRLFNVYGPRSRTSGTYGAVFGVFLAQKLNGKPFTVVGNGTQTRDFTYVGDVVEAFVTAANSNITGISLNVGSGNTYSVNRLVELLGGDVVHIPERPGEPRCTQADISKVKRLLGWKPTVSFEDGVSILLENIDYWREATVWTPDTISYATREWFEYLSK
ncbi:MAG: SDR family oxidoreductase [Candidatus Brocadiales bacterium]|nr:SDR family oxidoreductase [Candidatus Brocadiales bacterium]